MEPVRVFVSTTEVTGKAQRVGGGGGVMCDRVHTYTFGLQHGALGDMMIPMLASNGSGDCRELASHLRMAENHPRRVDSVRGADGRVFAAIGTMVRGNGAIFDWCCKWLRNLCQSYHLLEDRLHCTLTLSQPLAIIGSAIMLDAQRPALRPSSRLQHQ